MATDSEPESGPTSHDKRNPTPSTSTEFLISEISVSSLFGKYNYRISALDEAEAKKGATPLIMLYGGNGSGKTTLLRMLWNLFSPSPNSGHRSYLRKTPFEWFEVRLGSGDVVKVEKVSQLIGDIVISVRRGDEIVAKGFYDRPTKSGDLSYTYDQLVRLIETEKNNPRLTLKALAAAGSSTRNPFRIQEEPDTYIEYLASLGYTPVLLADDRKMHFDTADDPPRKAVERRIRAEQEEDREDSQLAVQVEQAIRRTHDWLRQSVLTGAQEGSQSVDDVYQQVLSQLIQAGRSEGRTSLTKLRSRLLELERRSSKFTEFGIFSGFEAAPYLELLRIAERDRLTSMAGVIGPYLSSQDARLDKLQELEEILRQFVTNVNQYLTNKHIEFTLQRGLVILDDESSVRLKANQLSSGERQLLLLLCNALLSRSGTGLFIIDEPELSLNARWQRKIVESLLDCVKGSNVQFVMATHSIEILTTHRSYLARLEDR